MHSIGARLKVWREKKTLKQPDAATLLGVPASTYQKYEMGLRAPGAEAMECFVRAGINANWLLTGEGPMLIAELMAPPALPAINIEALEAIISGTLKIAPNAPADTLAAHCAGVYKQCIEDGLITPDGIGSGNLNVAA